MFKQYLIIIIILLLTAIIAISGCTTKTATNGTFGEKSISIDSIFHYPIILLLIIILIIMEMNIIILMVI